MAMIDLNRRSQDDSGTYYPPDATFTDYAGYPARQPGSGTGTPQDPWIGAPLVRAPAFTTGPGTGPASQRPTTTPTTTTTGGSGSYGTNVFSDPATAPYESLVNQRINQLQTPYTPPDFQPAIEYLKSYFQQLQGPAYTDPQMQVMQTQALDPLERQRTAAKDQMTQQLAARGIGPSSGVAIQALQNLDNQFNTIRAGQQTSFATNAINTQKQQQAQAALLGPQIANLEQGNFTTNQGRLDQAVNLASIIPTLAWNRLSGTQTSTLDPATLFSLMNAFQTQGANQGANMASGITSILPYLFQYLQ